MEFEAVFSAITFISDFFVKAWITFGWTGTEFRNILTRISALRTEKAKNAVRKMILLTPTFENVSGIFCVFWPEDPFFRKPRGVPGTLLWGDVTFTCLRFPLAPKSPWITVEFGNFLLKFPRVTFVIPITQPRMRCAQLGVSTATDVVDWFNKSYFTYTCARLRGFFQIEHGFFYFSWNQLIKISKKKFVKLTLIFDANNLTKKKYLTQCWWNEKFNLTKKYFVKSTLL